MSKLSCKCGFVMIVHTMEEGFLYDLVPQKNMMEIVGTWNKVRGNEYPDLLTELYDKSAREVYECPSCSRLLVKSESDPNRFYSYIREDE